MRPLRRGAPVHGHPPRAWERQEQRLALGHAWWALAGARPGWRVADVGCGAGRFCVLFADLTGPTGHVHAVDRDPGLLEGLRGRLDPVHHAHVTTEVLDIEEAPLPDLRFDLVVLAAVLHHLERPEAALANLRRSGAAILVAEVDPEGAGAIGPPVEERIPIARTEALLREHGWEPVATQRQAFEHYAVFARPR